MDMYQAFATFMRGMKMNKATWDSLSPEAQQIWDQLSQRDKNTSLRSRPGMSPSNTRRTPPKDRRLVHNHPEPHLHYVARLLNNRSTFMKSPITSPPLMISTRQISWRDEGTMSTRQLTTLVIQL